MIATLGTALLYVACVAFYHANQKRTVFVDIKKSPRNRQAVFAGAWALALLSLFVFASAQGWERGIPIWLGVFSLVGGLSLAISTLAPAHHVASGLIGMGAAILAAIILIVRSVS